MTIRKSVYLFILLGLFSVLAMVFFAIKIFETSSVVKIAVSVPESGTAGESIANAVELAFTELDYKVGDFDIELLFLDGGDENGVWGEDIERENAEIAVADPDVMAYIGTYNSGAAKISIPILNKGNLVQISPGNTWPGLTKSGFTPGEPGIFYPTGTRNYFRVCTTDDQQGPAGAIWADELGFKSIYIINDGGAYGAGISSLFKKKALSIGLEVLGDITIDKKASSYQNILQTIQENEPDLVYYGGTTLSAIALFIQEMRAIGITSKIMGPDGIAGQDFIDLVGRDLAEGVYATTIGVSAVDIGTKESLRFNDAYMARYQTEPGPFAVLGYETAHVVIEALKSVEGERDRVAVMEAVRQTNDFGALLDTWSFDDFGDTNNILMSGAIIKDGVFEFVNILTAPAGVQ
ncbi:MAG: branched-chain amino acid transport system substrate-binding protein [Acidimicrobiales bacterium]|jgi:branched-chain amino acid transport system substrate-binding protein